MRCPTCVIGIIAAAIVILYVMFVYEKKPVDANANPVIQRVNK